jgi:uncharacterized protein
MLYFLLNFVAWSLIMGNNPPSRLRFNFGFLLEASLGTSRTYELDYPEIRVSPDVTLSPLQGELTATRTSEGVYVSGRLHSKIEADCVRCLETAGIPISIQVDELFYYPLHNAPPGALTFEGDSGFIDLAPLVRELGLLDMPINPVCRPNCQGLCIECGQNLNEGDCGCVVDDIDPRLANLRQFLE